MENEKLGGSKTEMQAGGQLIVFKPKSIKVMIDKLKAQREREELDGEQAFTRGESCPPSASFAFKNGYARKKRDNIKPVK